MDIVGVERQLSMVGQNHSVLDIKHAMSVNYQEPVTRIVHLALTGMTEALNFEH